MTATRLRPHIGALTLAVGLGLSTLVSGGCATRGDVSGYSAIATARYALAEAESQGADEIAPDEMARARRKLAEAEKGVKGRSPGEATRLAEQATADAKLAAALARKTIAEDKLAEANRVRRENEALRSEARKATRD